MLPDLQFWEVLTPKLDDERRIKRKLICSGGCADYAAYREAVGFLKAMDAVKDMAKEAFEQLSGRTQPPPTQEQKP